MQYIYQSIYVSTSTYTYIHTYVYIYSPATRVQSLARRALDPRAQRALRMRGRHAIYLSIYLLIYIYLCMYIYIYTYTHIFTCHQSAEFGPKSAQPQSPARVAHARPPCNISIHRSMYPHLPIHTQAHIYIYLSISISIYIHTYIYTYLPATRVLSLTRRALDPKVQRVLRMRGRRRRNRAREHSG